MKRFLKKIFSSDSTQSISELNLKGEIYEFINDLISEALEKREGYSIKLSDLQHYEELKNRSIKFNKDVIIYLLELKNLDFKGEKHKWKNDFYYVKDTVTKLLSLLVRSQRITLNQNELSDLIKLLLAKKHGYFMTSEWPFVPLLSRIEKIAKEDSLSPEIKRGLGKIKSMIQSQRYVYVDEKKILEQIERIQGGHKEFNIDKGDVLGREIVTSVKSLSKENQEHWMNLLIHFSKGLDRSTPTKTWLKQLDELLLNINDQELKENFTNWINVVIQLLREIHKTNLWEFTFLTSRNIQLLRSMVWTSAVLNDDDLNQTVEELGLWSFKKLSGHGSVSAKLGNACIYAFSKLPYQDGVSRLTKFRAKIKYPSVHKLISKAIKSVAESEGKSMDEIEELAVQDFQLNKDYQLIKKFDNYKGIASVISSSSVALLWENENGKQIKSIPKHVKENFPEELKAFKKQIKEAQSNLGAQSKRIERMFLAKRKWSFSQWKKLYIDNNLLAFFGTKLIWNFSYNDKVVSAVYINDQFVNPEGIVDFEFDTSNVEIWHPALSTVNEVQEWRHWLMEHEIKQPFKQAHREVYIVTDAENQTNTYSNRFAAHILRQHVFNALCKERGWIYNLQGQWDSHNIPVLNIPSWNYKIEFWVDTEGVHEFANDIGILNYVQTDQVRFYDNNGQLEMAEVPPLVFSEVMRDVDLFVGVSSIGADPNWTDNGEGRFQGYWNAFSFGDLTTSGKERGNLLKILIPKLEIKDKCEFEGNFLVVNGKKRTYKIHLGSGNILMKPNDQYLCIVADRRKSDKSVFLPFEGDSMLSMIISKALLLANDEKIKDPTILSQINR